jgi:hypothetical protein
LQGEIVQLDGRLLVSPGSNAQGRTPPPEAQEQALLFVAARVAAWRDVVVPSDLDASALKVFLRQQAPTVGLSTEQPFVFRVEGRFPHLLWHVVTGEAPAAGSPGGHGGHGAGQANARSGRRVFRQPGASGQWVGVYSGPALEGMVSHPSERLHIHFRDADASVSGQVDRISIAAGAVLKLPLR